MTYSGKGVHSVRGHICVHVFKGYGITHGLVRNKLHISVYVTGNVYEAKAKLNTAISICNVHILDCTR
jgi:hypothetical protein